MPMATQLVIGASEIIRGYWAAFAGALAAMIVGVALGRRNPSTRVKIDALLLRIPVFGDLITQINMARLVTYMALFYRTGVEIVYSLELSERLVGNRAVARAVRGVREAIIGGESLGAAFSASPVFPAMVVRTVSLGEITGHLDEALNRASIYYEREIPAAVRRMVTILQPALIALMGGAVLLVAMAIILPILGIYDSIGQRR